MSTPHPPLPRNVRIIVNVDQPTAEAVAYLAYISGQSKSAVVAECLGMLMPVLKPVLEDVHKARARPAQAMAIFLSRAQVLEEVAADTIAAVREAAGKPAPPSSNTGG